MYVAGSELPLAPDPDPAPRPAIPAIRPPGGIFEREGSLCGTLRTLDFLISLAQHLFASAALFSSHRSQRHRSSLSGLSKITKQEPLFRCTIDQNERIGTKGRVSRINNKRPSSSSCILGACIRARPHPERRKMAECYSLSKT